MSRRGNNADLGSLELLLDTICNTFGGVIFIAILVVVLLQMTGASQPVEVKEPQQAKLKAAETSLADAVAELKILEDAAQGRKSIVADTADPELVEQARLMVAAEATRDRLLHRRNKLLQSIAEKQIKINDSSLQKTAAEQALEAVRRRLEVLQAAVAKEVASRSQTAKLPKLRETTKEEIPMVLRGGRLYVVKVKGPGGFVLNDAECEMQNGGTLLTVRPGAGLVVDTSSAAEVDRRLGEFDGGAHYLAVFTWPDSFEQFSLLRSAMVRLGFEYRLVPLPQSDPGVRVTSEASGSRKVQ